MGPNVAKLGQVGAKMRQVGAKCGPRWGRWTKVDVKKDKIGKHRPKMKPKRPKMFEHLGGLRHGGGRGELPGDLRIGRIWKSSKV